MIYVYHRKGCGSSKRSLDWLNNHSIEYRAQQIEMITEENLRIILSLTNIGFEDIFKRNCGDSIRTEIEDIYQLSINQAIKYTVLHTKILRTPIIFSNNKLLIGFNEDEIRKFIPSIKRSVKKDSKN